MTLCPIAMVVNCRKCAIVSVCPVKTAIGDFVETKPAKPDAAATKKIAQTRHQARGHAGCAVGTLKT